MKSKGVAALCAVLALVAAAALWGCPKKTEVSSAGDKTARTEVNAASANDKETNAQLPPSNGLKVVFFDFNKAVIRDDAKPVLKADAEWLKSNPAIKVRIEGNCDPRGTAEYNQALGQRRAESVKKYLIAMGVSPSNLSLVSYGKEKPVCSDSSEICWQKDRRDDFSPAKN